MAQVFNTGETVRAHQKSGTYIGKIIQDRGEQYLVEVLAVEKHPLQGDIHNYGQTEGVFFHERKALAPHEKMNVKKAAVHPYEGAIPDYGPSLKQAVEDLKNKLSKKDTPFNHKALQTLENLEQTVYHQLYYT
ncbi:Kinase-associated lipoprotein [Lentibacillus sp. JNUCC-1]|uniref:kinase-associated lipoprotein B n=1 Tax=Lentibacillus sp. JNUCC-1 TaxID=2654513 RepID=UPI0012E70981|nr:kinase-associated lipoprotein B [Lentibacillus sp. JNUCC-1]MUV39232.1 Kinase-associated lipoprotein [Lentibacillus sp. JNUCC-1]